MDMRGHMEPSQREQLREEHVLELLDRYFLRSLSPEDADALRVSLSRAGINLETLEALRQSWDAPRRARLVDDIRWASITERLGIDERSEVRISREFSGLESSAARPVRRHSLLRSFPMVMRMAAVVMVIVLAGGLWSWKGNVWSKLGASHGMQDTNAVSTYATANGERATITLPDGTQVLLNVGSRLEVPDGYKRGTRTLRLTGEAFFTVRHAESSPFTVIAGPSTTRVLGTRFVVRHYATDSIASVAVHDGKVAVGTDVLVGGQQARVSHAGTISTSVVDGARFSFVTGVLRLNSVPLHQAIGDLNRWYNADIQLGDSTLATQHVMGGFPAGSLTDLAAIMEMMFDVDVVRQGRVLTLFPKRG